MSNLLSRPSLRTIRRMSGLGLFIAASAILSTPAMAQTFVNGSFEDNTTSFTSFPGYVSTGSNPTIASWTSNNNFSGLNNELGTGNRFANNGGKPDGQTVAFLQVRVENPVTSLSQLVSGFVVGQEYNVEFLLNQRQLNTTPSDPATPGLTLTLTADADTLYSSVVPGAGSYSNIVSSTFTAANTSVLFTFAASNPNGGDSTALIDNVRLNSLTAPAAPEPATAALLLPVALGGLSIARRRRASK